MDKKFKGKTLLVLGSNVGSEDIVRYSKNNGAYTIVADYLPPNQSPAKLIADEHWLISTVDTEALYSKAKKKHVDGIFAGISELNLLSAMSLSEKLGLRFYCKRKQWDLIENKASFRKLCESFSVPCPHTYHTGGIMTDEQYSSIEYPVILKPVDSSSSIGVVICNCEKELRDNIQYSLECSKARQVIIEEYFEGEEFAAHYTISNGIVSFSSMDKRYPIAVNEGNVTTIPIARVYPSPYIDNYITQVNDNLKKMIGSLDLNTGVLFVQGLYNKVKNKFVIFEAGLRSAGEMPCRFIAPVNGIDYMNNIVDYILLGEGSIDISKDDPNFHGKSCALISFVTKGGVVGDIEGIELVTEKYKEIIGHECRYKVGDITPNGNTLRQIMIRFVIVSNGVDEMTKIIQYINNTVKVLDNEGNEMCLKFDAQLLKQEDIC